MITILLLTLMLASPAVAETLRVMTFNVRYPAPNDGDNAWEKRRDILVETIRRKDPDLMGTQELFQFQGDYIVEKLPRYRWFGISRRGNHEDENMGVFYKPEILAVVDEAARVECAGVIAARMRALPADTPFVMTGDFNTDAGGEVHKVFSGLKDAWLEATARSGPPNTFGGWNGRTTGDRIDWILYRGPIRAPEAEVVTYHENGHYPSDHYPVFAVLEFR